MKRIEPTEGQESVWDYPRPPRAEVCSEDRIVVKLWGQTIVDSSNCVRVLETSHPPVYYIPIGDLLNAKMVKSPRTSWCEYKGKANYFDLQWNGERLPSAGWFYSNPTRGFELLQRTFAVYPSKMDSCFVNGEQAHAQAGDFYGGWITGNIVGPFKGGPGTMGW